MDDESDGKTKVGETTDERNERIAREVEEELRTMVVTVPPVEVFRGMFDVLAGGGVHRCGTHGVELEHSSRIGYYCPHCRHIEG